MVSQLDEILNWGIPILLILIVAGFLWVKVLRDNVAPMLGDFFSKLKNTNVNNPIKIQKEISYD